MLKPSNTKIEQKAINALESVIDAHMTMDYEFNTHDKEIFWDGYIYLYRKSDGNQSKRDFEGRVPVQIKGHCDNGQRYINKQKIHYAVSLEDLKAYATEKGVLYFQILMNDGHTQIFYSSLYPSKIADYLEEAKKRHNEKNINIPFIKLEKDPAVLYIVAKQFNEEALKQGSAYNPLVQDRIRKEDFDKITSINLSVIGAKNPYEALLRLSTGDVCIYGTTKDDKYPRPIEWQDESIFYIEEDIHQDISVNGKIYYHHYSVFSGSEGEKVLKLSPNLTINLEKHRIELQYKAVTSLKEIYTDASFLLHINDNKAFSIAGHILPMNATLKQEFHEKLRFQIDLYELLEKIGFNLSTAWSQLTDQQFLQLKNLVQVYYNCFSNQYKETYYKYLWSFDGKNIPIIIQKNDNSVELLNGVYTEKLAVFMRDDDSDEIGYRMPLFFNIDVNVLSNLYFYDYNLLREQINNCDINSKSKHQLNNCVLHLINVFDLNNDLNFLDLAEYLLRKLDYPKNDSCFLLNSMQIKKRRGLFCSDDIEILKSIEDDDKRIQFGKYVLLEDKTTALELFDQFSKCDKD